MCHPVVNVGHGRRARTAREGHGGQNHSRRRRHQDVSVPGRPECPGRGHAGRPDGARPHLARGRAAGPRPPHRLPHRDAVKRRPGHPHDRLRRVRGDSGRPAVDPPRPGPPLLPHQRVPRHRPHHAARFPAPRHGRGDRPLPLRPAPAAAPRRAQLAGLQAALAQLGREYEDTATLPIGLHTSVLRHSLTAFLLRLSYLATSSAEAARRRTDTTFTLFRDAVRRASPPTTASARTPTPSATPAAPSSARCAPRPVRRPRGSSTNA